jgi:putative transposase
MRPTPHRLDAADVHRHALDLLQRHLPLRPPGRKTSAPVLWALLLTAAARRTSLSAACRRLRGAPSDEAARTALRATLPDRAALLDRLNGALTEPLPRALRRRPQLVAADLLLVPYHGRSHRRAAEIYRAKSRAGTGHFHAYATAVVVARGLRFTLALEAVDGRESMEAVLIRLLDRVAAAGVTIRCLLLDSGFYEVGVIAVLQGRGVPFLMPAVRRGRRPGHPKGPSGTRRFDAWRRSGWSEHTLREHGHGRRQVTVAICVKRLRRRDGRGHEVLIYACWHLSGARVDWVRRTYRKRFGIEASYRQLHQGRARTSTRHPGVRLLYVGLGLVLRNVWAWLHWEVLSSPRRGGRRLHPERLRLAELWDWLAHEAERELGARPSRACERPFAA